LAWFLGSSGFGGAEAEAPGQPYHKSTAIEVREKNSRSEIKEARKSLWEKCPNDFD